MIYVSAGLKDLTFLVILDAESRLSASCGCGERKLGETVDFLNAFLSG